MAQKPERNARSGVTPAQTDSSADAASPMDRFRSLARRLIRIPKDEVKELEQSKANKQHNSNP